MPGDLRLRLPEKLLADLPRLKAKLAGDRDEPLGALGELTEILGRLLEAGLDGGVRQQVERALAIVREIESVRSPGASEDAPVAKALAGLRRDQAELEAVTKAAASKGVLRAIDELVAKRPRSAERRLLDSVDDAARGRFGRRGKGGL